MAKGQKHTYAELEQCVSRSAHVESAAHLVRAKSAARTWLYHRDDPQSLRDYKRAVARLVMWLDTKIPEQVASTLIVREIRKSLGDLSGKTIKNRRAHVCPVCDASFKQEEIIDKSDDMRSARYTRGAKALPTPAVERVALRVKDTLVVRYYCLRCESAWEDRYAVIPGRGARRAKDGKPATPAVPAKLGAHISCRVAYDGRMR